MGNPENRWSWSDRLAVALACMAGAMALALLWMEKTPIWATVTVACMAALMVYPVLHFVHSWRARIPVLLVVWGLIGLFGWRVWPYKPITANASVLPNSVSPPPLPAPVAPVTSQKPSAPQATPQGSQQHRKSAQTPSSLGSVEGNNNTFYGNTGKRTVKGSGNTFVGPTDSHGNIRISGGTAVGNGASADSSGIAIGSNAHAGGMPQEQQTCEAGSICNQDSTNFGNQQVTNNFGPKLPNFLDVKEVELDSGGFPYPKEDSSGHPLTNVRFYADEAWDDPRIGVICDRPCMAGQAQPFQRSTLISPTFISASSPEEPNIVVFIFQTIKPMSADTYYVLTLASKDSIPVKVLRVVPIVGTIKPH